MGLIDYEGCEIASMRHPMDPNIQISAYDPLLFFADRTSRENALQVGGRNAERVVRVLCGCRKIRGGIGHSKWQDALEAEEDLCRAAFVSKLRSNSF